MQCLRCGKEISGTYALCSDCAEERQSLSKGALDQLEKKYSTGPLKELLPPILKVLPYIGLLALIWAVFFREPSPYPLPNVDMPSTGSRYGYHDEACKNNRPCLIVFLATWCPACHGAIPFIKGLKGYMTQNQSAGLKIVIGGGDTSDKEEMAKQIGGNVYFDNDDEFARRMGGGSVPHLWVVDGKGMVVKSEGGLPAQFDPGYLEFFKKEILGSTAKLIFPAGP